MAELTVQRCHAGTAPAGIEVVRFEEVTTGLAAELAELTRSAYAGSDPLPGLPEPDGQFDTAAAVLHTVAGPGWVYTLAGEAGRAGQVAALRVRPARDCWRVSRISVSPAYRNRGLVRSLLDAVARDARHRGIDWLELDAVVERCLPPLYARLGFRVLSNWPSPDKPLSEVTMRRSTGEPAVAMPLAWRDARLSEHATVVGWLLSGQTLLRIPQRASGDPLADTLAAAAAVDRRGLLLAGVDLSLQPGGPIQVFAGAGRLQPDHLMPRNRHPDTLALWRPRPGGEPSLDELTGG
jgi:GNAT superfamily N-acetyltransferase